MKKLIAFTLVLLSLALLPLSAHAAEVLASGECGAEGAAVTWSLDSEGTLTISGTGEMKEYILGDVPWYNYRDSILTVKIEDGVTSVCYGAFSGYFSGSYKNITSVTVSGTVENIGGYAFSGCTGLNEVSLGSGITEIGGSAFSGCESLTSLILPDSVKIIGNSAFSGCENLEQLSVGKSLEYVGEDAFYRCRNLEFNIYKQGKYLGNQSNPYVLLMGLNVGDETQLAVHSDTKCIAPSAFYNATTLTSVSFPSGLVFIGDTAFYGCTALEAVSIPNSVTRLGNSAFTKCSSMLSLNISTGLTEIPMTAFADCSTLKSVSIPSSIRKIGSGAFVGCTSLVSVTVPDNVTHVGNQAFAMCSSLETVKLGKSVAVVEDYAFDGCVALRSLTVQNGIRDISMQIFGLITPACEDLQFNKYENGLYLGNASNPYLLLMTTEASSLKEFTVHSRTEIIANKAFDFQNLLKRVELPDGLKAIGSNAFSRCYRLCDITLPESVTYIGVGAFLACYELENIVITDSVTHLGEGAFSQCWRLSLAVIGRGINEIPENTFMEGKTISVWLPVEIQKIAENAFQDANLCDIYYEGNEDQWALVEVKPQAERVHLGCTDPQNHWQEGQTPATCTENGYTFEKCDCGYTRNSFITNKAFGHSWDDGVVTKEPTDSETGVKTFTCATCKATRTEDIPKLEASLEGVTRLAGADRYKTAFLAADMLKEQLKVEKFDVVVVASGTEFADALSGSYLAAVKNAPMLLVRNNKTTLAQVKEYITKNLNAGGTVYILGGVNAVPKAMESGLDGFTVKRLGGNTRYDTNLLILKEAGVGDKDILICTGKGFADSLSASAAKLPILLVKDSLNDAQKAFLKGTTGKKYVIGGTTAVNARIENALKAYGTVTRLGGSTRYETSVLVAKTFFDKPAAMAVAYAQNFPDGLSGGALAAAMDAPLILSANGKDKAAADYAKELGIKAGYVLGGTTLISDKTAKNIFSVTAITVK